MFQFRDDHETLHQQVTHKVLLKQLDELLNREGGSPKEISKRQFVKAILGGGCKNRRIERDHGLSLDMSSQTRWRPCLQEMADGTWNCQILEQHSIGNRDEERKLVGPHNHPTREEALECAEQRIPQQCVTA